MKKIRKRQGIKFKTKLKTTKMTIKTETRSTNATMPAAKRIKTL